MEPPNQVLITGASSGVGKSLTHFLAGRFHVLAAARGYDELMAEFGANPHVTIYRLDLANPDSVSAMLDVLRATRGYIPYLINNAGVNVRAALEDLPEGEMIRSLRVNAVAPAVILQRLLPAMKANNFGRVINVTSGAPLNCFPEYSAYSASKAALNAITVTAAREYSAYNIKINLMSPGPVRTNMAPSAAMDPAVCHATVDYLLGLDNNGPSGRFFWLGYEIPLFPDLEGIQWLEGRADQRYRRVL